MPRLFAADVGPLFTQGLHDIFVADLRANQPDPLFGQCVLQRQIAHDGGDHCLFFEAALFVPGFGTKGHDYIAVEHLPFFVAHQDTIGVAVQRHTAVSTHLTHFFAELFRVERTAIQIDVGPVGVVTDGDDRGPQLLQHGGGHSVAGPVGTIDHNAQAIQRELGRKSPFQKLDIAAGGVIHADGAADLFRFGPMLFRNAAGDGLVDF